MLQFNRYEYDILLAVLSRRTRAERSRNDLHGPDTAIIKEYIDDTNGQESKIACNE